MKNEEKARPSWDEYFMDIAGRVSTRSKCMRRQVGAVIVKDRRILCTGYNGPPTGIPHCEDIGCLRGNSESHPANAGRYAGVSAPK